MPVLPIVTVAFGAGLALVPAWIAVMAVALVTAIGAARASRKARAHRVGAEAVAAHAPGAVLFSLAMHGLLIGLPYLAGGGVRLLVG